MLSKVIGGYSKHIHSFHGDADGSMSNYASSCSTDTTGSLGNPEHFSSDEEHVNPPGPQTVSDSEEDNLSRRLFVLTRINI